MIFDMSDSEWWVEKGGALGQNPGADCSLGEKGGRP